MTRPATQAFGLKREATQEIRKYIEVELPLAAINEAGRTEKAVPRKGLPATMHLWWSRKPVGVARAVLFASLVDHPTDRPDLWPSVVEQKAQRDLLMELIIDLARWNCPAERISEANNVLRSQFDNRLPEVVDPFCGGGAIPFAAASLGLPTTGIDLNPVAAITTKALIEIPALITGSGPVHPGHVVDTPFPDTDFTPMHNAEATGARDELTGVAVDVAAYGNDLIDEAHKRIGHLYPPVTALDGSNTKAVSYLWARTARCVNSDCATEIPLLSTWWLSKKKTNLWHVRPKTSAASGENGGLEFEVVQGPKPESLTDLKIGHGANYRCPACAEVLSAENVRMQGQESLLGLRLVAVQTFADPMKPRSGRAWTNATAELEATALAAWPRGLQFPIANYPLPTTSGNVGSFGLETLEQLLTPRQRLLMTTASEVLAQIREQVRRDAVSAGLPDDQCPVHLGGSGATAYSDAVTTYLAITISRMANRVSTMTVHNRANGSVEQSFIQPGYAFYGDFPEADPFSGSTGSWANALDHVTASVSALPVGPRTSVICGPALESLQSLSTRPSTPLHRDDSARMNNSQMNVPRVFSTDPPYYDMFDYAALSALFYPWLRLTLHDIWPRETTTIEVPHEKQIISNHKRFDGDRKRAHAHFEDSLATTLAAIRGVQASDLPFTLYYGYQQTQAHVDGRSSNAWEALLTALVDANISVVRTWPLRTERPEGVKSRSNSLASSVLLVCRRRSETAPAASEDEFLTALNHRFPRELEILCAAKVAAVDLAQSMIGPGMEIFTSFEKVVDSQARRVSTRTALQLIYSALDTALIAKTSAMDPETCWAINWYAQHGFDPGPPEEAQTSASSVNLSIHQLVRKHLVVEDAGSIRLRHGEHQTRSSSDPSLLERVEPTESHWSTLQAIAGDPGNSQGIAHLSEAGDLRMLAYHLYSIAETKHRADEALRWNSILKSLP